MSRHVNELMQRHNTNTQMQRVESEAFRDLERRFGKIKMRLDSMRDHTVGGINDLISLT